MSNSFKNIVVTPNRNLSGKPQISFTGFGNSSITLTAQDDTVGRISFDTVGSQLFSIDTNLSTGDLFNVNNSLGLSIFSADASGNVNLSRVGGKTVVGSGGVELPVYTTAGMPAAEEGLVAYDTTEKSVKVANGTQWVSLGKTIVRDGLICYLDAADPRSYSTSRSFVKAKIYSVFGGGARSANYTVQWSDNNSTWTTAFSGVMGNNTNFGFQSGTGSGDGSYGPHRYWRYIEGAPVVSHHPRCSRIQLTDINGQDVDIIVYTNDNINDSGTYIVGTVNYDSTRTWHDVSNNHNSPVMVNTPTYVTTNNGGFSFDNVGTNNFSLDHRSEIINRNEGTIGGWVRWNNIGGQNYVFWSYGGNGVDAGFLLQSEQDTSTKLGFGLFRANANAFLGETISSQYVTRDIYMVGTWYYGRCHLYINGDLKNYRYGTDNTNISMNRESYLRISSEYNRSRGVNGNVYTAHIYNRALTASEIRQNFEATRGRFGV